MSSKIIFADTPQIYDNSEFDKRFTSPGRGNYTPPKANTGGRAAGPGFSQLGSYASGYVVQEFAPRQKIGIHCTVRATNSISSTAYIPAPFIMAGSKARLENFWNENNYKMSSSVDAYPSDIFTLCMSSTAFDVSVSNAVKTGTDAISILTLDSGTIGLVKDTLYDFDIVLDYSGATATIDIYIDGTLAVQQSFDKSRVAPDASISADTFEYVAFGSGRANIAFGDVVLYDPDAVGGNIGVVEVAEIAADNAGLGLPVDDTSGIELPVSGASDTMTFGGLPASGQIFGAWLAMRTKATSQEQAYQSHVDFTAPIGSETLFTHVVYESAERVSKVEIKGAADFADLAGATAEGYSV